MTSYKSSPERFSDRFSSKHSPPVPELPSQEKMSSLECSEVRDSPSEEQMLAASEVSWLDKIGEDNNKNKQSERSQPNDCHYYEKQTNSMKFSFNKNDMEISRPRVSGTREALNQQQTLKQIYYQEFDKQSSTIKNLQEERKTLLLGVTDKNKNKTCKENKENLYGSIKRHNKPEIKPKKDFSENQEKTKPANEEDISLKYLQDSLAKKSSLKIPLSKLTYLEESKTNKNCDPVVEKLQSVKVKQFDQSEEILISSLQTLFDQLDKMKIGRLFSQNCNYQSIREEFKIAFGYVLVRIMFKDLMMNKEEFVMLGLQVIKQLDSIYVNALLKSMDKNRECRTIRLDQTIKRKHSQDHVQKENNYRSQIKKERRNSVFLNNKLVKEQSQLKQVMKSQEKESIFEPICKETHSRYSQLPNPGFNNSKFPHQKCKEYQLINSYRESNYKLQKDAEVYHQYLMDFKNDNEELMPEMKKKIRNISEQMILEHKKNLEFLIRLNDTVETYLSRSRRRISQISQEKYHNENSLITDRFKNSEWMCQL